MKRLFVTLFTVCLFLFPTISFASTAVAPTTSSMRITMQSAIAVNQPADEIQPIGFRGGSHSFGSHSFGSRSRSYSYSRPYGYRSGFGSFGSHLFAFGSGLFLGRLFNPFGYGYGYGFGFGFFHIIFDVFIVWVLFRIFRGFFRR